MTAFDLIAFGIVIWSAISGSSRGVVAEILGLFAMAISAMATIGFLPATAPIVRHMLHAGWLSAVVAAVITFIVFFLFLRLVAATLTHSINRSTLGGLNRLGGLVFGAARGVVFLGLLALLFNRITPPGLQPGWITGALTYPAAAQTGRALGAVLPKTFDPTGGFGGKLTETIRQEGAHSDSEDAPAEETAPAAPAPRARHNPPSSERAKPPEHGYTKHARESVDSLVERSK